ncbi:MAG: TDT family transporter [Faecousia sp.]
MKKLLKALPLPIAAVMLGLFALGNLIQSYSEAVRLVFGAAGALIWVLLIAKAIVFFPGVKKAMDDVVVASVTGGTFPMSTMLLAAYLKPFIGSAAAIIWYVGVALHVAVIVWFTLKFMVKLELPKVFPSYFIVYVGIAVASLTSPAFGAAATIGTWAFWFGFVTLLALLVLVTYRYVKFPVKMDPPKPLFCIYAAPASLCLAGYIQAIANKSPAMIFGLLALSSLLYIVVLVKLPGFLKLPFFPSYAAFTFPFVITAIAAKQSMACLTKMGMAVAWLKPIVLVETIIATVLVLYATCRYIMAISKAMKADA